MGKTESGAVWLDPEKTSPYDFYQYWRNVADADVLKCIRMLTFLPLEEIDKMDSWEGSQLNTAKEILAYELTKLVHGEKEAKKAQTAAKALFAGGNDNSNMPNFELESNLLENGEIGVIDLLCASKLTPSKGEARRLIQQGGVSVDDEKVTDLKAVITSADFEKGHIIVKKGITSYHISDRSTCHTSGDTARSVGNLSHIVTITAHSTSLDIHPATVGMVK